MSNPQFRIREAEAGDVAYIVKTWLSNYRYSPKVRGVPNGAFFDKARGHHAAVCRTLARSIVLVACHPERSSQIFGFFAYGPEVQTAHYIFTKREFQGWGIAKALANESLLNLDQPISVSHWTPICRKISKKGPELIFNPYLLTEFHCDKCHREERNHTAESGTDHNGGWDSHP